MYGYGYGVPPPPYGAPPPPYGYGAPAPPSTAWGAAPPAPYGAPPPSYGAPPPPPSFGILPPPHAAPAPGYSSSSAPAHSSQPQPQPRSDTPATPSAPPATSGSYPSLTAPPPTQVVAPEAPRQDYHTSSSQPPSQRPASANPGAGSYSAPPEPSARPVSATPSSSLIYPYGAAPAPAPAPNPQQPVAPYTYGQQPAQAPGRAPAAATPPAAAPPAAAGYLPPTTYAPAPGHGGRRRRALLVGCSYPGTSAALNGCLNDVQCIQYCLQHRFGFTEQQILVLRDDPGRHHDFISTKANIFRGLHWLLMDQQPGDSLFFHFSGHGSQQYDYNGDEEDGYDETICPTDFRSAGQIVDDELNRLMVQPLQPGVTLHAVVDACHSGTALDLAFRAKVDAGGRWYWKGRPRYDKMTRGGTAFQFGACKDSQVAQDTNKLSGRAYTGAATFCFIQAIERYGTQQTYGQILSHMMATLRAATGAPMPSAGSLIASFLLGGPISGGGQTPVLSCDKQVDLYTARLSV